MCSIYSGFGVGQKRSIADLRRSKNTPPFARIYIIKGVRKESVFTIIYLSYIFTLITI